jgi:hypothetical protein
VRLRRRTSPGDVRNRRLRSADGSLTRRAAGRPVDRLDPDLVVPDSHPSDRGRGQRPEARYIGSSSKISTAHFPSLLDRNGRPSVNAFAAARSSASTIV